MEHFLPKEAWPPNSPDLNPLDFYYWNAVVTRMKRNIYSTVDELKEEIRRAMSLIPEEEIQKAVMSFNSRVRRVEDANGNLI